MNLSLSRSDSQKGITGLETAIILIAFVVVASVFAFTVLSTGIFASERSKETVFAGIEEAQSSIEPRGSVVAYKGVLAGDISTVFKVTFVVSNAIAGEPVDLTSDFEVVSLPLIGGDPAAADELANLASREALKTATKGHGLARVTVRGLDPNTTYFVRARSAVGAESTEFPAASTIVVPTASLNSFIARSQQLHLRFQHPDPTGWIVMATNPDARDPVSAVVGDGAASNEAVLNLAQMFTVVGNNYEPVGETTITLRIREGGGNITTPSFDVTFIETPRELRAVFSRPS